MVLTAFAVVAVITLFLLLKLLAVWRQMRNLPPGPFSIPWIGSLCVYSNKLPGPQFFDNLSKQYGELTTIWFNAKPTVVVSSMNAVRNAFSEARQHDFSSRSDSVAFDLFDRGWHGTLFTEKYNSRWKALNKLTGVAMKSITDNSVVEGNVERATRDSLKQLAKVADGKTPVNLANHMSHPIFSLMLNFCFGENYDWNDPEYLHFQDLCLQLNSRWEACQYIDCLPLINYLPKSLIYRFPGVHEVKQTFDDIYKIFQSRLKQHQAKSHSESPRDILDALNQQNQTLKLDEHINTEAILGIIHDLFISGNDTQAHLLRWYFLYMVKYPEVQKRCYEELKLINNLGVGLTSCCDTYKWLLQICGNRPAQLEDRQFTPYVEASIYETLRLRPFLPFGTPHCSETDQQLMGYTIPKGVDLVVNTLALHYDATVYANPNCYDPANFIGPDGSVLRPQSFFSFGVGRRMCIGAHVSKNYLYLIVTRFLQTFQFLPIPDRDYSDQQANFVEFFCETQPYEVLVKVRDFKP